MKEISAYIQEGINKHNVNFNDKKTRDKLNDKINHLDSSESIAGLNCWDLSYAFGEYAKENLNVEENVECIVFEKGRHYVPVITQNNHKFMIDFTVANQHHFNYAIRSADSKVFTKEGWAEEKRIPTDEIPNKVNSMEIEDPSDLFNEFDFIFN